MSILTERLKDVQKIGFLGYGISNRGAMKFLRSRTGAKFVLRSHAPIPDPPDRVELKVGAGAFDGIDEQVLMLSPSVKRDTPEIMAASARGVLISSDTDLFFEMNDRPIYAISGSDGKSTTCELAYRLLRTKNPRVLKCGNCGSSALEALDIGADGYAMELSSFMLEYSAPHVYRALITNITENHIDWHGSLDAYVRAKENLTRNAERRAFWCDGGLCERIAAKQGAHTLICTEHTARDLAHRCEDAVTLQSGRICINGTAVLEVEAIRRREPYNVRNFMSAIALCLGDYDPSALTEVARGFGGIPHRAELIGERCGIEYIDSSIDSSPARTRQTLLSLGRRVVLILGGRGKGLSYDPLCEAVADRCCAVVLMGENAEEIYASLMKSERIRGMIPIRIAGGLEEATHVASKLATDCRTVLLSPASTSFNEFKNFEERGDFFKQVALK